MPPTDSMEKPPTVERTGRPIAAFSNSYARLPERTAAPRWGRSCANISSAKHPACGGQGSGRREPFSKTAFQATACFGSSTWIRQD